jgi:hypothetical protein
MDSTYEPHWSNYLEQFKNLPNEHPFFQMIPSKELTQKFCIMIEPREHPLLEAVLKNFMALLSKKGWGLLIFHGTHNQEFVNTIVQDWKQVYLCNLGVENLTTSSYNQLLMNLSFWNQLESFGIKNALIFQTDVVLLQDNVDDFLEYDYVGAPWNPQTAPWCQGKEFPGGNGGFSLRNVSAMKDCVLSHQNTFIRWNEDIFFSVVCHQLHKRLPPMSISSNFSVETYYAENLVVFINPILETFLKVLMKNL